jgi:hypothetical protein
LGGANYQWISEKALELTASARGDEQPMNFPTSVRTELIISMTLAETFLLLLFVIWSGAAEDHTTTPPEMLIQQLREENEALKNDKNRLEASLSDLTKRLEFWRTHFGELPQSEKDLPRILQALGRGKPPCQEPDNMLVAASVVDGKVSLKVLTPCPDLKKALLNRGIDFSPGVELSDPASIDRVLVAAREFRRIIDQKPRECRFDYRLIFSSYKDYYEGREKFEKVFYTAGRTRLTPAAGAPQ